MRNPALLLLSLLAACAAPDDARHSPLAGVQRVLAIDFGPNTFGKRLDALQKAPLGLAAEFRRVPALQQSAPKLTPELARMAHAQQSLTQLLTAEAKRDPTAAIAGKDLPQRWAQHLVDAFANVPYVLGLHRRPLSERDDRQHRTDPDDARPEAGWLQRVARRLQLTR